MSCGIGYVPPLHPPWLAGTDEKCPCPGHIPQVKSFIERDARVLALRPFGFNAQGTWKPTRLNPLFRFVSAFSACKQSHVAYMPFYRLLRQIL
jgi:hypothetical protein